MTTRPSAIALLLVVAAAPAYAQSAFEERWRSRVRVFEDENARLAPDARTVVLLGSSSMEGWKYSDRVRRFLPAGHHYLNRGISGDGIGAGTTGVGNRLKSSAFDCRAGTIFLLNGHNSVGSTGSGLESTARIYGEVVARLRAGAPGARLVLVTCQPTKGAHAALAPHLVRLNERIRAIGAATGCEVIDLHAKLVAADGLSPRPGLSSDGLHMSDAGYELLGREIARILATTPPAPTPPPVTPEPAPAPAERTHLVRPGDTLGKIAARHGTTVAKLVELNGITNENVIVVGRRLKLPPGGGLAGALPGA